MTRKLLQLATLILLSGVISCSVKPQPVPVLLLATDAGFGTYTAEILKTEGFNEFAVDSLSDEKVSASYLNKFDMVILAESNINPLKLNMIREYAKNGGKLIALHPYPELAELFGVAKPGRSITGGYIRIEIITVPWKC
jgi:hypothetical protein